MLGELVDATQPKIIAWRQLYQITSRKLNQKKDSYIIHDVLLSIIQQTKLVVTAHMIILCIFIFQIKTVGAHHCTQKMCWQGPGNVNSFKKKRGGGHRLLLAAYLG